MNGFVKGYYNFATWVTRLAYVNILWVAFTILGLGVFGLMPATAAMFAVTRKWIRGEPEVKIFPLFWETYRKEFVQANILGLILVVVGYLLFIQYQILRAQDSMVYLVASFGVLALCFVLLIIMLYIFPIFSHFNLSTFQNIKWACIIGIVHPILTLVFIAGFVLLIVVTFYTVPALFMFFGGSVTAFILTWGAAKTFPKYEEANI